MEGSYHKVCFVFSLKLYFFMKAKLFTLPLKINLFISYSMYSHNLVFHESFDSMCPTSDMYSCHNLEYKVDVLQCIMFIFEP